jgi:predicted Zn-ribbon and HTH transcriptional regulator
MARWRRIRRFFEWAGVVVSLLIVAAWGLSLPWSWEYRSETGRRFPESDIAYTGVEVEVSAGVVSYEWGDWLGGEAGWHVHTGLDPAEWLPSVEFVRGLGFGSIPRSHIRVPLWMPFLVVVAPTIYLWRTDRRLRPGHCRKCGYYLTADVGGVCPECGRKAVAQSTPPTWRFGIGPLRRNGRILKWSGLVICLFMFVAGAVSLFCMGSYYGSRTRWTLNGGCLLFDLSYTGTRRGWALGKAILPPTRGSEPYLIELWMLFLFVAAPTAFLWWVDRRGLPPGHCRECGYNLTGNVSGICPECGEKIAPQQLV